MICPNCQSNLPDGIQVCYRCGAPAFAGRTAAPRPPARKPALAGRPAPAERPVARKKRGGVIALALVVLVGLGIAGMQIDPFGWVPPGWHPSEWRPFGWHPFGWFGEDAPPDSASRATPAGTRTPRATVRATPRATPMPTPAPLSPLPEDWEVALDMALSGEPTESLAAQHGLRPDESELYYLSHYRGYDITSAFMRDCMFALPNTDYYGVMLLLGTPDADRRYAQCRYILYDTSPEEAAAAYIEAERILTERFGAVASRTYGTAAVDIADDYDYREVYYLAERTDTSGLFRVRWNVDGIDDCSLMLERRTDTEVYLTFQLRTFPLDATPTPNPTPTPSPSLSPQEQEMQAAEEGGRSQPAASNVIRFTGISGMINYPRLTNMLRISRSSAVRNSRGIYECSVTFQNVKDFEFFADIEASYSYGGGEWNVAFDEPFAREVSIPAGGSKTFNFTIDEDLIHGTCEVSFDYYWLESE